jgi:hypothetical protein
MIKDLNVPKGKDLVGVWVTGHTYLRLMNSEGAETFRFDSPGNHVTAVVQPGPYTIETDGKLGEVKLVSLPPHLRTGREADSTKPPMPKAKSSRRRL